MSSARVSHSIFRGYLKQSVSGGPVQTDRAFLLHQSDHEGPETESVMGQVKLGYSLVLEQIVRTPPRFRVFLGYAG